MVKCVSSGILGMRRMHFGMILTKALTQSLENDQELIKLIKCNDPMKSYNDQVL